MKILFVHQNFPGQYLHLARYLGDTPGNEIVFITQRRDEAALPGVKKIVYAPKRAVTPGVHHYLKEVEVGVLNSQAVARVALELKRSGFVPDLMLGHNGWGEIWYLKEVFPNTPLLGYFEFFYRLHGSDVGFDPSMSPRFDDGPRLRTKNLGNLLALEAVDAGQCATPWQKSQYPKRYHPMLHVVHEGIDTQVVVPNRQAQLPVPNTGLTLTTNDEVVTYVARNLEPYRGFPSFLRSLPTVLAARPRAQVLIARSGRAGRSWGVCPASRKRPALDRGELRFEDHLPAAAVAIAGAATEITPHISCPCDRSCSLYYLARLERFELPINWFLKSPALVLLKKRFA